jgi:carbonic anhydrase/acetyltransferase-like protein (isoleucine patch superfamily)
LLRYNPPASWNQKPVLPSVAPDAYVDQSAVVIGAVTLGPRVIVCPGAVIRGDEGNPIVIGPDTNIQDAVVIHALKDTKVEIGSRCSVAHGAIVHGPCTIGPGTFIGFRAVLLKTNIGDGCFVGHGAMVLGVDIPKDRYVPPGAIITTESEVQRLTPVPDNLRAFMHEVLEVNAELVKGYRETDIGGGP